MPPIKRYYIQALNDDAEDCSLFVDATSKEEAVALYWKQANINDWDAGEIDWVREMPAISETPRALRWGEDVKAI